MPLYRVDVEGEDRGGGRTVGDVAVVPGRSPPGRRGSRLTETRQCQVWSPWSLCWMRAVFPSLSRGVTDWQSLLRPDWILKTARGFLVICGGSKALLSCGPSMYK